MQLIMIKVITYGTYDLLHYGHIKLLERAKALGDYLVVGITADDFDKTRGKINVQQSLMERVEAVQATGLADEIIIEEYEGQKIDDIKRLKIDIFTVGSDWIGTFDYLNDYCKVIYLDRTQGVSSSEIRAQQRELHIGIVGESTVINKFITESNFVNGIKIVCICTQKNNILKDTSKIYITDNYEELLSKVDAVYVISHPTLHYKHAKLALEHGKHVLCESPVTLNSQEYEELSNIANNNNLILVDGIKTAYSTAYSRMLLLAQSGKIGEIISVDATCTSMHDFDYDDRQKMLQTWNSITAWSPTALLPIFQLLGVNYQKKEIISRMSEVINDFDEFTKIAFVYSSAVASLKVGKGVKSEGELIISGTKGYIYVPAPWWKTEYFEIRYEDSNNNKRFFYQLDGEGIRYEIVAFMKAINNRCFNPISHQISTAIVKIMEDFTNHVDTIKLNN